MKTSTEISGRCIRLKISGRFNVDTHHIFHRAYRKLISNCQQEELSVDLAEVEDLDSTALGMLLLLRQDAKDRSIKVNITRCQSNVASVLRTAHFDRLFAITS